jgi:flagellar protein FliJ
MTRAKRLAPVQKVMESTERERAGRMGLAQRRVAEAEAKLAELERYHADYAQNFNQRASLGIASAGLRDYQTFLARLVEAVHQQRRILVRTQVDLEADRRNWQEAARRVAAVGTVVERWRDDERREADQREQRESDERATLKHNRPGGH